MADIMSVDTLDPVKHDSDDSGDSGPENESTTAGGINNAGTTSSGTPQDQPIKRKGGRKPIYATSEERKQRNRQAQAAFRERRTEYIKQLEETIRVHEQNLHNLQTAHRHAADECLMLRYKNSLLERILLEKGIDVQAELRAKTGSPNLGPTHMPQNLVQPPPIPRAILNRHHARRSNSSIAPKLEPGVSPLPPPSLVGATPSHPTPTSVVASPKSRPTPSSHSASPAASTPVYGASPAASTSDPSSNIRPVLNPPPPPQVHAATMKANLGGIPGLPGPIPPRSVQQQHQQRQPHQHQHPHQQHLQHQQHQQHQHHAVHHHAQLQQQQPPPLPSPQPVTPRSGGVSSTSFYPVPSFQNHMEQLEQEYDAADDMIDDTADGPDTPSAPGPYSVSTYSAGPQPLSLASPATSAPPSTASSVIGGQNGYPSMTQLLDPALDWDPFGLSASMQFPTQFSFDTSNTR